ncbi:hypothetical protein Pint_21397 [Pistacia integerrima]|uniref:Uncharacterized protein n=1 Tax=Pistacia integerrima TaxID=434235 RepID=A0ACC0XCA3_9ROSI|nr:hypothetical protein Pint_21397 [Pistacia integerrima]
MIHFFVMHPWMDFLSDCNSVIFQTSVRFKLIFSDLKIIDKYFFLLFNLCPDISQIKHVVNFHGFRCNLH